MVRRIEGIADEKRGVLTYELADGRRVCFDRQSVELHGLEAMLRHAHVPVPTGRVPVYQDGEQIGTLPALFDPATIRSRSIFYDIRPGDFRLDGDRWIAAPALGPGDLEAVPGFQWDAPRRRVPLPQGLV